MARALLILVALSAVADADHREPRNFRRAAAGVYTGGVPEGADWGRLAELGIRTVVGVDGPPPDASAAAAAGARVVHIPIGYGTIDRGEASRLTRVAREAERPLFIYCHHGQHRGPAAAAIVCRAAGLLDRQGGVELLRRAGTDPKYVGLWKAVEAYQPPADGAELPPLVAAAPTPPLVLAMSRLDRSWAAWAEADPSERERWRIVVEESLRESRRVAPPEMVPHFDEAIGAVVPRVRDRHAVAASCVRCHDRFRDRQIEDPHRVP